MTLLNEITGDYPDAVSFAAGRPYEGYFDTEALHRHLRLFAGTSGPRAAWTRRACAAPSSSTGRPRASSAT